jgi:hypothetical protein
LLDLGFVFGGTGLNRFGYMSPGATTPAPRRMMSPRQMGCAQLAPVGFDEPDTVPDLAVLTPGQNPALLAMQS